MAVARTGAERYFSAGMADPEYRDAHDAAVRRVARIDQLVRELDRFRQERGLSKAALARRAGLPAEAVRRLFTADHANPTAMTLAALADALDLDLVPTPRRVTISEKRSSVIKRAST